MLIFSGAYATLYLVAVRRWPQLLLFVGSVLLVISDSGHWRAAARRSGKVSADPDHRAPRPTCSAGPHSAAVSSMAGRV